MLNALIATLLPQLSSDQRDALLTHLAGFHPVTKSWQAGEILFQRGQRMTTFIILTQGLVRVFDFTLNQPDGKEINLRFLSDASVVLPFYSVSQQWQCWQTSSSHPVTYPTTETAQCVTKCTGISLPLSILDTTESWATLIKLELAIRHYHSMEQRLRLLQMTTAMQRYQLFQSQMPSRIVNEMPNHHVASYLGITPETLSRVKRTCPPLTSS